MMPFSDEDLKLPVSSIIESKIAPMLAQDGGAISLLSIKKWKNICTITRCMCRM